MSPRPSVQAQRREEVLAATCEMIAEVGFRNVRVSDVARRAGISTGVVHYYFGTKEQMLDDAFRYAVQQARQRSLASIQDVPSARDRLDAVLDVQLPTQDSDLEWPLWLHLWAEALMRPPLQELNRASYENWIALIEGIILAGQASGEFRKVSAHDVTLQLLTMIDGLVIQSTLGAKDLDARRVRELVYAFVESALGTAMADDFAST
ncbi:MAG: TetR family transcriptional regulator [Actinobacteria bacterium]|nr:TetR family transcriptional regulator [Actinomycetota bacterium]